MATKKKRGKRKARKQSSERVSTIAAKLMIRARDAHRLKCDRMLVNVVDVLALAGSALSQDETKGQS